MAWCLRHPAVTSVISGVTKVSQLEDNIQAADAEVPDDVYEALCELFPGAEESSAP
ncbi:MAG: aldo/keto reductase [Armatimonadota bacterium]